jgi:hypothetical protein
VSEHPHEFLDAGVARQVAYDRQGGQCARCWTPMQPDRFEAHHRRKRAALGWCMCNVVALHPRCHTQGAYAVHDHPAISMSIGLIVPIRDRREPCEVPVHVKFPWDGDVLLSCCGTVCSVDSADIVL